MPLWDQMQILYCVGAAAQGGVAAGAGVTLVRNSGNSSPTWGRCATFTSMHHGSGLVLTQQ